MGFDPRDYEATQEAAEVIPSPFLRKDDDKLKMGFKWERIGISSVAWNAIGLLPFDSSVVWKWCSELSFLK